MLSILSYVLLRDGCANAVLAVEFLSICYVMLQNELASAVSCVSASLGTTLRAVIDQDICPIWGQCPQQINVTKANSGAEWGRVWGGVFPT